MSPPLNYQTQGAVPIPRRNWLRTITWAILWIVFIIFALFVILMLSFKRTGPADPGIPVSAFYAQVKAGNVSSMRIDGDTIEGTFLKAPPSAATTGTRFRTDLPAGTAGNWTFTQWVLETSPATIIRSESANNIVTNFLLPFVPWLLIMAFIWFCISRATRRSRSRPLSVILVQPEAG